MNDMRSVSQARTDVDEPREEEPVGAGLLCVDHEAVEAAHVRGGVVRVRETADDGTLMEPEQQTTHHKSDQATDAQRKRQM